MDKLNLFVPITKVDVEKRLVYGIATCEKIDSAGEICDYETTKPFYEKWSSNIAKVTDGKSLGNVRAMHGPIAAGKLTSINFDDAAKRIEICAKVVDDAEWTKVNDGVYSGFSQGGRYVKRWKDDKDATKTRYTAEPIEVSLVDVPCLPEATFEIVKADGTTELHKFQCVAPKEPTVAEVATKAAELAAAANDTNWANYILKAREELAKAGETPPAATPPAPKTTPLAKSAKQAWVHDDLPGQNFESEADLNAALLSKAALDAAKEKTSPVVDQIKKITDALDERSGVRKIAIGEALTERIAERDEALRTAAELSPEDWAIANKFVNANPAHEAVKALALCTVEFHSDKIVVPAETAKAVKTILAAAKASGAKPPAKQLVKIARFVKAEGQTPEAAAQLLCKSLYDVGRLASLISEINWLAESLVYEAFREGDGSVAPGALKSAIGMLCEVLRTLVVEETAELMADTGAVLVIEAAAGLLPHGHIDQLVKFAADKPELVKAREVLDKIGARHSKADNERIAKAHDLLVDLGAECKTGKGATGDLVKVTAERDALNKQIADMGPMLADVLKRVKNIEAQPMPGGPARTSVSKERDGLAPAGDLTDLEKLIGNMTPEQLVEVAIKAAQKNGQTVQSFAR